MYIIWKFLVQIIWFVCSVCCRYCYSLNFGGITTSFCCCCCVVRTSASSPAFVVCRRTSVAKPVSAAASYERLHCSVFFCCDVAVSRSAAHLLRKYKVICFIMQLWQYCITLVCTYDNRHSWWYLVCLMQEWNWGGLEGWTPPVPSLCLLLLIFEWKLAVIFNVWAKCLYITTCDSTPSTCKSIPTLVWIM